MILLCSNIYLCNIQICFCTLWSSIGGKNSNQKILNQTGPQTVKKIKNWNHCKQACYEISIILPLFLNFIQTKKKLRATSFGVFLWGVSFCLDAVNSFLELQKLTLNIHTEMLFLFKQRAQTQKFLCVVGTYNKKW